MEELKVLGVTERRLKERAAAQAMGIDEAYISELVETFYDRIRADEVLGPIFMQAIPGDWGPHLATMKKFWGAVALSTGAYDGKPVPAHQKHSQITQDHFTRWLNLFEETRRDTAPTPQAAAFFLDRAERIGKSLQLVLFGLNLNRP